MPELILNGIPAAPGIAIGDAFLFKQFDPVLKNKLVPVGLRDAQVNRLEHCIEETNQQLDQLRVRIGKQVGASIARIFESQAAILKDEEFIGGVLSKIKSEGLNTESAIHQTSNTLYDSFQALDEDLFRDRAVDIRDVASRMIRNLIGRSEQPIDTTSDSVVLLTNDLLPSDVVHIMHKNVTAIVTEKGGATSHTAILTRSLDMPSVMGLSGLIEKVSNRDTVIVNGNSGKIIISPNSATTAEYEKKQQHYFEYKNSLRNIEKLPARTLDGEKISLRANIELPGEVKSILPRGGEGVGLFRSEYLFLSRNRFPDEDEQFEDYSNVLKAVKPYPVTIRTIDLGGDKVFTDFPEISDPNPFMGWRAIRVSLDEPRLLRTQLRAILRASIFGKVKILFPFISGLNELRKLRNHLEEVRSDLENSGVEISTDVDFGVMIELPSAVMMANEIAEEVDFLSIGTNDLTQFTLAVDRGNPRVRNLYRPMHPAVVRMIHKTVQAGKRAGISVSLCGELAANPMATMLLIGLELDELSMSPSAIAEVKKIIRSVKLTDAKELALKSLEMSTAAEISELCEEEMKRRFADMPIWFNDH